MELIRTNIDDKLAIKNSTFTEFFIQLMPCLEIYEAERFPLPILFLKQICETLFFEHTQDKSYSFTLQG